VVAPPGGRAIRDLGDDRLRDGLGIYTRAFVLEVLALELARAARQQRSLAVAVVDVVGLRHVNNEHGHELGDALLEELDTLLRAGLRLGDVVGRYRDGAFVAVLPETALDAALRAVERACAIARAPLRVAGRELLVRLRVGVAVALPDDGPESLCARAAAAATSIGAVRAATADAATIAEPPRLGAGHVIGGYRVLHLIGEGGVGRVYRAEDVTLGRPVALKVLRRELGTDPNFLALFRSEATLLAAIQHPNLVQIYTLGEAPEGTFFAMELVEGETLAGAIARSQKQGVYLPLDRLLACLAQIASALDCLHQHGVLHRDIKPDNIALDPFRDRAVLLDVGVAQRAGRGEQAAGTPGFVAPEVIYGEPATSASDVFSLAVTAFQALTYRHPWESADRDPAQVLAPAGEAARRLSSLRRELAPADEVLARGLAYEPGTRAASATELIGALGEALMPVIADPEPAVAPRRITGPLARVERPAAAGALAAPSTVVDFRDRAAPESQPAAQTRGVVFKAFVRVVGNELPRWLSSFPPPLAEVLAPAHPGLAWSDTALFLELLDRACALADEPEDLARRHGRAVIRSSFQRFFPASTSTLAPERVLAAMPAVWSKYQSWGRVTTNVTGQAATLNLEGVPRRCALLPAWLEGLVAQTVVLCGGDEVSAVATEGGAAIAVEVGWHARG
jgi:serine/threonine-protein kinase